MTATKHWNHRWFGVWREYGPAYRNCPSVHDFVDPGTTATYDKRRLYNYLTQAQVVASTSRSAFSNPFTGELEHGSISYRTDGRWLWLDNLADYVDRHNVAIPPAFLEQIERNKFVPPAVPPEAIKDLEWPPLSKTQ